MKRTIHSSSREWDPDCHRDMNEQACKTQGQEAPFSMVTAASGDLWDEFVRDNWAPALEMDFGRDWRDKFSEEVIAILWWAVKNRNRFPGNGTTFQGSDDTCNGIPGPLPQMSSIAPTNSLGSRVSGEGIDDHQAPFSGLPLFGIGNSQASSAVQSGDGLGLGGVPVLPLVDQFEDAPCMDLPDIGDPPFASGEDTDPEGPSNKMARLLEPGLDLSLSMEPLFGGLTLDDNSEDDILDNDELVRAVMESEVTQYQDELGNVPNPSLLQEDARILPSRPEKQKVSAEGPLQATKRVKRTAGLKRQGDELSVRDQQGGSSALFDPPNPCTVKAHSTPEGHNGRGASPVSAQGKQPRVVGEGNGNLSKGSTLDTPYDPEYPGLDLGNVVYSRSTSQPLIPTDKSGGGFTFEGTEDAGRGPSAKKGARGSGHKDYLDSSNFGQDVRAGMEGRSMMPSALSESAWPPFPEFQKPGAIVGEPQKKAQKHRETDISGQGLLAQTVIPQFDTWTQSLAGMEGQAFDSVPQFSDVTTGRPITFGEPPNLNSHPHPMAAPGPSGPLPMPVMNSVLRLGYYGIYPTAAWGVAAGNQQQMQSRLSGAPMFCVPSTIPSQYGVPMMGIERKDTGSAPRGTPVSQPGVMPPMYIMDNRATAHSLQHIIDGMDALGRCPVHVAAMAGRADIIDQLIHVGCDCSKVLPVDIHGGSKKNWHLPDAQAPRGSPGVAPYPPHGGLRHESSFSELVSPGPIRYGPHPTAEIPPQSGVPSFQAPNLPDALQGLPPSSMNNYTPGQNSYPPPNLRVERDPGVDELSFKFANALHLAAFYGHINVAELLLSNNRCDPQARNEHGCTPLHFAANRGRRLTVARLLKVQGMKIDLTDMHGRTALHHAAAQGHADAIDELWLWRCKFDAVDVRGWTALHYAAHAGHTEVVGRLVIAGCPVTKFDNRGYTPAHLAAQGGFDKVLEKLLHAGYDPDTLGGMTVLQGCGGSTALHMASACGHANVVRQLLRERSNALKEDYRGFSALQCAAEGGHFEAFTDLLKAGCNPKAHDCCGTTVLHSAAKGGNWDIIQELLKLGCDHSLQTKFGCTALHHAAQGGAYQVAQNLLNLGCDIHVRDRDGNMPWHAAAEGGNLKVLELFLNKGKCNLEARNNAGCTALHCAARSGSIGAVRALLDKKADIKAVAADGQTALHCSMETGHNEVVALLLEYLQSATINLQDGNGLTVLHHAADRGNSQMVQLLIERGAEFNTQTNNGQTALHQSARGDYQGVAEALLLAGCDTGIRDHDGCTALHYAAQRANLPLFNLLFNTAKCKVGENDNKGFTLLHYAVEGGNPEIVGQLVFTGAAKSDSTEGGQSGMNALHLACKLGNAAVIPYLFKAGYKVGAQGPDGRLPLHFAALGNNGGWGRKDASQHFHVVKMLLDRGADPHVVDGKGCNALMYAAGSGDLEMVFKFLTLGVDCKLTDENSWTAMHWAATSGTGDVVTQLLKSGIPADTPDNKGRIPLHWASERGHIGPVCAILDVMVQSKADIHRRDYSGTTPVQLAATRGHIDVVAKLLESGKTRDVKGLTALHLAAQMRLDEVAKLLLSTGKCDVNSRDADGCTPLHYAAENGNAAIVELLLKSGADLNITGTDGMMPIHKAASEGHLEAVNKLIDKGALVNFCTSTGSTPLHYAASTGKVYVLQRLIEAGCPVNAMSTGSVSCTALYCAASNGQMEAVNMLLEAGAEVDTVCTNECTALHVAASNGHAKAVKRLLDAGADMDLQAANGTAAIHNAVNNGHLEALEVLLLADCDVDVQNSGGNNALHIAASKGSQDLTKLLLNSDCDLHIKNAKGWQAVHSAASNGFFDVVLILVQHGSQWRQKGDLDVAKLLCRKSNLKNSYVEGRLRLAERERHRKAKPAEVTEVVPSKAELEEKRAQADAAMAALLQEEEEKKEEEEAKKAKRDAKRDKKKKKKGGLKEEGSPKPADKGSDEMQKEKDGASLEGSSGTNAPEDDAGAVVAAPDLQAVASFAALSLSENSSKIGLDKHQGGGLPKRTPKKKNRKKVDKVISRGENDRPAQPTELAEKAPEDSRYDGAKGMVKIIRCHNTGTPAISTAKQTAAPSSSSQEPPPRSGKSSKNAEWKENPASARVISVPKSQVLLVHRSKRRMNDSTEGNGLTIGVQPLGQKTAVASSVKNTDATWTVPVPVTKQVTGASPRMPKNGQIVRLSLASARGPGTIKSPGQAGRAPASVWQKPASMIVSKIVEPPKPAAPSNNQPVATMLASVPASSNPMASSALTAAENPSKPAMPSEGTNEVEAMKETATNASAKLANVQMSRERSVSPSTTALTTENSGSTDNPRAWGTPGTMQGMRPPASTTQPTSVWTSTQLRPAGNSALGHTNMTAVSPSLQFPAQCDAPGVGFPFPGRTESRGFVPLSHNGGPFLPGMHSGLGEQIVLPTGDQTAFVDRLGQDMGETASDFLRRQAQSRIAQACGVAPWLNNDFSPSGGRKGEAPFPGMSHRSYGNHFNVGNSDRLGCDESSAWMSNQQSHPDEGDGILLSGEGVLDGVLLLNRGSRGIVSASWEEPKIMARHAPPPPPPPPPITGGKVVGKRQFCCPLTNQLMRDPVVAADGFTYERSAIEAWLHKHDRSPMSHKSMMNNDLVPNLTMRAAIHLLGPIQK